MPEDLFSDFSAERGIAQAAVKPLESSGRDRADLVGQDDGIYCIADAPRSWVDASGRLDIGSGKGPYHLLLLGDVRGVPKGLGIDLFGVGLSRATPEAPKGLVHQGFNQGVPA